MPAKPWLLPSAVTLITSKLDDGNPLLHGIPGTLMTRLSILDSLHWLPVMYKILAYAYGPLSANMIP